MVRMRVVLLWMVLHRRILGWLLMVLLVWVRLRWLCMLLVLLLLVEAAHTG